MTSWTSYVFAGLVGLSAAHWGRFRHPLKRGSRMDRVFGLINVFTNAALGLWAAAVPVINGFVGVPAFGSTAAVLFLSPLFLYRVMAQDLRTAFSTPAGRRSVPNDELRKTRWPYTLVYSTGYFFLLAYILTIHRYM
ncbi:hypothetical protein [Arthrobacter sp. ERGS1:01]|uniref:hypothetical protein n=1 Tax=Arthrobacter sp. ERGS1:01 TaxID=1704044 RepID=UPI001237559C|nr:hypothetical protein [Arthrobacter sp. ERGS1:01]